MDQDFPRGGNKESVTETSLKRKYEDSQKELFSVKKKRINKTTTEKRNQKKKVKNKGLADRQIDLNISSLTLDVIVPGLVLMGCVSEIQDLEFKVSLPGGFIGFVKATSVSGEYLELLEKVALNHEVYEYQTLPNLFHVGQAIICKVLSVEKKKKFHKSVIKLSVNPKEIYSSIRTQMVQCGSILQGCVSSIEDHGYMIDVGINGMKVFINDKQVEKYIENNPYPNLFVGSLIRCRINLDGKQVLENDNRVVKVIINPKKTYKSFNASSTNLSLPLNSLIPGMIFTVVVTKKLHFGLKVRFGNFDGCIPASHIDNLDIVEKDTELNAIVLFIDVSLNKIVLSCKKHLIDPNFALDRILEFISVGDIIDEACVFKVDQQGVYFKISDIDGYANKKLLKFSKLDKDYSQGSKHRVKIIKIEWMDGVVIVGTKESLFSEDSLSYESIFPGMIIDKCVFTGIYENGIFLKINRHVKGYVNHLHITDVPNASQLEYYEKISKMSLDDRPLIKCKVLCVDAESKRLSLTLKKKLIKSKCSNTCSFDDVDLENILQGFIVDISNNGLVILFYNNIKGFAPRRELSVDMNYDLKKCYHLGQVVKCRVIQINRPNKTMVLSLNLTNSHPIVDSSLDCLLYRSCSSRIIEKSDSGFKVSLGDNNKIEAFLPMYQLSDYASLSKYILDAYNENDILPDILCYHKSRILHLTNKFTFKDINDDPIRSFSDLKHGMVIPGFIHKIEQFGARINCGGGIVGLCPLKYLANNFVPNISVVPLHIGQSVMVKVVQLDELKNRALFSMRLQDCYHDSVELSCRMLHNFVENYYAVIACYRMNGRFLSTVPNLLIGNVVKVTLLEISDVYVKLSIEGGIQGYCHKDNMKEIEFASGKILSGVVLYIHPLSQQVEVNLCKRLFKAVKTYKATSKEIVVGLSYKGKILSVTDDVVIVMMIKNQGIIGKLCYISVHKHLNDFVGGDFVIGNIINVTIHCNEPELPFVGFVTENILRNNSTSFEDASIGDIVDTTVTDILPMQLNIRVGYHQIGRIHITEIADLVDAGVNPLDKFQIGDKLKVKILSVIDEHYKGVVLNLVKLRKAKFKKKSRLECSLKESKMKSDIVPTASYQEGDIVHGFVSHYSANVMWLNISTCFCGKVYIFNISNNIDVLKNPLKYYNRSTCVQGTVISIDSKFVEITFLPDLPSITPGCVINGLIHSVNQVGVKVILPQKYFGYVSLTDISDLYYDSPTAAYSPGDIIQCYIFSCNEKENCILSLRNSRINQTQDQVYSEIDDLTQMKEGDLVHGYVIVLNNNGIGVTIGRNVKGWIDFHNLSKYYIKQVGDVFYPGRYIEAKIINVADDKVKLSLLEKDTGIPESVPSIYKSNLIKPKRSVSVTDIDVKRNSNEISIKARKRTLSDVSVRSVSDDDSIDDQIAVSVDVPLSISSENLDNDSGVDSSEDNDVDVKYLSEPGSNVVPFEWLAEFTMPCETVMDKSDESSDDEDNLSNKKVLTKNLLSDKALYLKELELQNPNRLPETSDDYDRLVLGSPDSSMVWLRYMAFHLESAEFEKARTVAERALKTISFREEQEKLNVWFAYLNLENLYGGSESLKSIFDRALQMNEPIKIYRQMADIYISSNKYELADELFCQMMKKFGIDKDIWIKYGLFCFKNVCDSEKAHQLLTRSFNILSKKDHVDVICKFAQMEFKYGDIERGKTMFENLISSYTKRLDLWFIYIDMLSQHSEQGTRLLYERLIGVNIPTKKMRTIFKKFLDFETKYGDESRINYVKDKAIAYVESKSTEDKS